MLESRNSYGDYVERLRKRKGYEWRFQPDENDPGYVEGSSFGSWVYSDEVFSSEETAIREGKKWMKSEARSGIITAVKATPEPFVY